MEITKALERKRALRQRTYEWQKAAVGLLAVSVAANTALFGLYQGSKVQWSTEAAELRAQVRQAEETRDRAVRELGAMALSSAREQQERAEQAAAYEAIGAYQYIGECTVTYYCPCEECCGRWADGVTATGLPAGPGIVAVDPDVIALGSTVVIDGVKYLAADTGVTGSHIDICVTDHAYAEELGVRAADVWVVRP